jgi:hypothetical protein
MKIRNLALALMALTLVSCNTTTTSSTTDSAAKTSDSSAISASAVMTKSLNSKLYFGSLSTAVEFPCSFFDVAQDVPYVKLSTFVDNFFNGVLAGGTAVMSVSSNVITNNFTKATLTFDCGNNTVSCSDLDLLTSTLGVLFLHSDPLSTGIDTTAQSVDDKCSRVAGKTMNWNLDKYYMSLVSYNGEVYAPFSLIHSIFLKNILQKPIVFNGSDFYMADTGSMFNEDGNTNSYGEAYYGGSLVSSKARSESYSKYFYGTFLFEMGNFNGHISSMSFKSLDSELETKGYKSKLLSSDSLVADKAVAEVINNIFADGGHTGFLGCGLTVDVDTQRDQKLMTEILETDSRTKSSEAVRKQLSEKRGTLSKNVNISGETAVITLDSFSLNEKQKAPTKADVTTDTKSTFAILYNSFKEIEKNTSVKNVVLDVSLNPGGAAPALGETLSFLTDEDITFMTKNPVTGAGQTEVVRYDTNLDGDFTDKDSYEGKYNFYILTSEYSFSCANILPCIAKDYGYAKIIGQRSGGGDCMVGYGSTVDGTNWQMSSTNSVVRKDGTNMDDGCALDYTIDYANFYDLSYLDNFLKTNTTK